LGILRLALLLSIDVREQSDDMDVGCCQLAIAGLATEDVGFVADDCQTVSRPREGCSANIEQAYRIIVILRTYFVWSSGAVAICLKVPFKGTVGWETMYAAIPTWTPVDTTSSVAQSAAATSAMIVGVG
jgi:hypothetical protein